MHFSDLQWEETTRAHHTASLTLAPQCYVFALLYQGVNKGELECEMGGVEWEVEGVECEVGGVECEVGGVEREVEGVE